jgi:predicted nucleic acid-binding protein
MNVGISEQVSSRARALTEAGFGALDAAHIAYAEAATCGCLLTCDDRLIRVARRVHLAVRARNPVEYVEEQTHA